MKYALKKQLRQRFTVVLMSRVFEVSKSGHYRWLTRPPCARSQDDVRLGVAIKAAHARSRQTYGPERLQRELAMDGFRVDVSRIKRLRWQLGLRCIQRRRFKATTNSKHALPVADNVLQQDFSSVRPNQTWVSDITYIPTDEGWLYLAGINDLHTYEIVGYALGERMTQDLVSRALSSAVVHHRSPPGLILLSDRGSQYCAHGYQRVLKRLGIQCSMSRKGNCYDNAPMESFWGTLKRNSCITDITQHAGKRRAISSSTSRFSITANADIQSSATWCQRHSRSNIRCAQLLNGDGVYY